MTSAIDKLHDTSIPALHWILSKRLKYSRSWRNVEVVIKKKTFEIRWVDPKWDDPEDKDTFCSRVGPLTLKALDAEIERQHIKYTKEKDG